jgi:hypothetical protein
MTALDMITHPHPCPIMAVFGVPCIREYCD